MSHVLQHLPVNTADRYITPPISAMLPRKHTIGATYRENYQHQADSRKLHQAKPVISSDTAIAHKSQVMC